MIKINLLPHREAKRKELKTRFYSLMVLSVVAAAAIIIIIGIYFSAQLSAQNERNDFIKAENLKLDDKIKEVATLKQEIDALKARQQAVEDLQSDRNQPVFMMNELVKQAPEGLYLTSIRQEAQKITLKGYAQSHAVVGVFAKSMNDSEWLYKAEIVQNKAISLGTGRDAKRVIEFDMTVNVHRPRELEAAAASAAEESAVKQPNPAAKKP